MQGEAYLAATLLPMSWQDNRLGEFLRARRARLRPEDVGLPAGIGVRRTPGLRREEVATSAGVSVDYYTRLEQGREVNPSAPVLDAIAAALRFNEEEQAQLHALSRLLTGRVRPMPAVRSVSAGALLLLENLRPCPAHILSPYSDILAANPESLALHVGLDEWPPQHRNTIRYLFRHPATRALFPDWDRLARITVARTHRLAAHSPAPELTALIDELHTHSREFADLWARHEVSGRGGDRRLFHHPVAGEFALESQTLYLGDAGSRITVFQAHPGTPDHAAMLALAQPDADRR
jgi:transcriptional regulator with XRE-family HTH domain